MGFVFGIWDACGRWSSVDVGSVDDLQPSVRHRRICILGQGCHERERDANVVLLPQPKCFRGRLLGLSSVNISYLKKIYEIWMYNQRFLRSSCDTSVYLSIALGHYQTSKS